MLDEENNLFIGEDKIIKLTNSEKTVLSCLIDNKHRYISAKTIGKETYRTATCVRNIIFDLRHKLGRYISIQTRGNNIGYIAKYIGDTNDNQNSNENATKKE